MAYKGQWNYYLQWEDTPPVYICAGCGREIYEGEEYWKLYGHEYCTPCSEEGYRYLA